MNAQKYSSIIESLNSEIRLDKSQNKCDIRIDIDKYVLWIKILVFGCYECWLCVPWRSAIFLPCWKSNGCALKKRSYIESVTKEIEEFVYSERPCERPVPNHSVTIIKNHSGEKFYSFNR